MKSTPGCTAILTLNALKGEQCIIVQPDERVQVGILYENENLPHTSFEIQVVVKQAVYRGLSVHGLMKRTPRRYPNVVVQV